MDPAFAPGPPHRRAARGHPDRRRRPRPGAAPLSTPRGAAADGSWRGVGFGTCWSGGAPRWRRWSSCGPWLGAARSPWPRAAGASPAPTRRPARAVPGLGLPTWMQRLVLGACGAALVSTVSPAAAAARARPPIAPVPWPGCRPGRPGRRGPPRAAAARPPRRGRRAVRQRPPRAARDPTTATPTPATTDRRDTDPRRHRAPSPSPRATPCGRSPRRPRTRRPDADVAARWRAWCAAPTPRWSGRTPTSCCPASSSSGPSTAVTSPGLADPSVLHRPTNRSPPCPRTRPAATPRPRRARCRAPSPSPCSRTASRRRHR